MNHLNVFFNNEFWSGTKMDWSVPDLITYDKAVTKSDKLLKIGNRFLNPFRYLFHGKRVIFIKVPNMGCPQVKVEEDYKKLNELEKTISNLLIVAVAIAIFIPWTIIGTALKLAAYISSSSIREKHHLAILRCTTDPLVIGTPAQPANYDAIKNILQAQQKKRFNLCDTIVVYSNIDLAATDDPGFLSLNPRKLILVGTKLFNFGQAKGFGLAISKDPRWKTTNASPSNKRAKKSSPAQSHSNIRKLHMKENPQSDTTQPTSAYSIDNSIKNAFSVDKKSGSVAQFCIAKLEEAYEDLALEHRIYIVSNTNNPQNNWSGFNKVRF